MPARALVGGLFSLGGQLLHGRQQRRNVRDQTEANKELAQFTHDRNVELWREAMDYDHPARQMERFGEAGLNPHLIYGQGTPGLAGTPPKMDTPQAGDYSQRGPMVNPMTVLQEHLEVAGKKQQLVHVAKQIALDEARTDLAGFTADGVFQQNTIRAVEATISAHIMKQDNYSDMSSIAQGRIGAMKAENWLQMAVSDLKRWEAKFALEHNMTPRDSMYYRMAMDFFEFLGFSPKQIKNAMSNTRQGIKEKIGY